jgi:hypothetical protein
VVYEFVQDRPRMTLIRRSCTDTAPWFIDQKETG